MPSLQVSFPKGESPCLSEKNRTGLSQETPPHHALSICYRQVYVGTAFSPISQLRELRHGEAAELSPCMLSSLAPQETQPTDSLVLQVTEVERLNLCLCPPPPPPLFQFYFETRLLYVAMAVFELTL